MNKRLSQRALRIFTGKRPATIARLLHKCSVSLVAFEGDEVGRRGTVGKFGDSFMHNFRFFPFSFFRTSDR